MQRAVMAAPARCAVIGAGISGAALADAMARRGWAVTVFDTHPQPAQGGSGVPAALVAPLPSADDNPATRLTRHGLRWMRQALFALSARGLLRQGLDWEASGVTRVLGSGERQWQADGLWLRPAALVRAWLAHPQIAFCGEHPVARLTRHGSLWHIEGPGGKLLAQAELVLLANGLNCQSLLKALDVEPRAASAVSMLHAAFGTVSIGVADGVAKCPAAPVNGAGSLIPTLPDPSGHEPPRWLVGADFSAQPLPIAQAHAANLQRLRTLAPSMRAEPLAHWQGQRCVSHDRMPLVGPLLAAPDATLWLCTGMGARGMAWAGVCAELLASRISGEPWPLARDLARHVDSQRRRAFIRDKA
jgi:tRNA 5-methylaminomethyl-2-thiouridine biosynthesis bifunctional protein